MSCCRETNSITDHNPVPWWKKGIFPPAYGEGLSSRGFKGKRSNLNWSNLFCDFFVVVTDNIWPPSGVCQEGTWELWDLKGPVPRHVLSSSYFNGVKGRSVCFLLSSLATDCFRGVGWDLFGWWTIILCIINLTIRMYKRNFQIVFFPSIFFI